MIVFYKIYGSILIVGGIPPKKSEYPSRSENQKSRSTQAIVGIKKVGIPKP